MRHDLVLGSARELGTVGLVAGLSGCYAGVLVTTSSFLAASSEHRAAMGAILQVVSTVFILIAVYVAAVVIVNAVDTVISGRLRHIALLRLLGASGRDLRTSVMRGTATVGAAGASAGILVGTGMTHLVRAVLVRRGTLPEAAYPWFSPQLLGGFAAIVLAATAAGWLGSRVVLRVAPASALAGNAAHRPARRKASLVRAVFATIVIVGGLLVLGLGGLLGESNPGAGFVVAFFGAAGSATGFLIGARFVIPGVVALCSRLLGSDPSSVVARRNAVMDPLRTTRATMGLVIGVALVTTFASGTSALRASVAAWELDPARRAEATQMLGVTSTVLICIIVISSVIAAVGFVSTMSLTVIQRHREIGLLRSLGFTRRQVRTMITKESVALSASAVTFGILLGLLYGTVGAQSLVGSQTQGIVWGLPFQAFAVIAVAGLALVLVASQRPARRAVAVAPVEALRMDG